MKRTLVIGGTESFIHQSIKPVLRNHGLELVDVWAMESNNSKSYRAIPKNVEVVVHLVDMSPCGHIHGTAWRQETERSGRTFIASQRKKSFLIPDIERAGFFAVQPPEPELTLEPTPEPTPAPPPPPPPEPTSPPTPAPEPVVTETPKPETPKPEKKHSNILMPKRDKPRELWEWYRFKGPELATWMHQIRKLAAASKYTQRDFSDLVGINQSELSQFFRGTPRNEVVSEFTRHGYRLLGELLDLEMPELQRVANFRGKALAPDLKPTSDKPPAPAAKIVKPAPTPAHVSVKEEPVKMQYTTPEATVPVHMAQSEARRPEKEPAPAPAGVSRAMLEDVLFDLVSEKQLTKEGYRRLMDVLR